MIFICSGGDSISCLAFGVVLFGRGIGNTTALPPLIGQQDFGAADQQRVVALIVAYAQAAFALAPAVFGFVRSSKWQRLGYLSVVDLHVGDSVSDHGDR